MLHKNFPLDLEGFPDIIDKLPHFIVHFSDNSKKYVNNISEAITFSNENGLNISSFVPVSFDDLIFENTETLAYEIQNLAQSLLYAANGQREFVLKGYEQDFFSILAILKTMEQKINEIKSKFEVNFELLEHFSLQLEEMKGGK